MYLKKILLLTLPILMLNTVAFAAQASGDEIIGSEAETSSLSSFLESDFVRTSVWPGIGPFNRVANDNKLVDPSGNQLTYSTVGKSINSCQLELHAGPNEAQSMLNLQMSVDFLLEGLGAKPGQIHNVNAEVTKNSKLLVGNNYNPVQAVIAPLAVSLQNLGVGEGTESPVYRVIVTNKNLSAANTVSVKPEDGSLANSLQASRQVRPEPKENVENETVEIAIARPQTISSKSTAVAKSDAKKSWFQLQKTDKPETKENKGEVVRGSQISQENPAVNAIERTEPTPKPAPTGPSLSKEDQLKKDFQDVIQNWQRLKKTAIKEHKSDLLSQALAGKALIRQSDAIKWLVANHKYYDMTPGGAKIEKITPIVSGKKYTVYAEVKEKTKFMDETTNQVLKETDDTYKVNYTIEKIGEHWLITDSALIKTTAAKSAESKPLAEKNASPASARSSKAVVRSH